MIGKPAIQYLTRPEIDPAKWDLCLGRAHNGLIYGYSFYLDHMADHWDALVIGDYEYIMPLTWRRKWGIKYLFQPPFTQQLGIFSGMDISPEIVKAFLESVEKKFSFAEIFMNYGNGPMAGFEARNNFILPLSGPYGHILEGYKKDLKKNLRYAENFSLEYIRSCDATTALAAYEKMYAHRTPHLSAADFLRFRNLCIDRKDDVVIRAVHNPEKKLLATAVLLSKNKRLHLVQSTTLPGGREVAANHFLLDQIVREFSGNDTILDFEGSDIDGIAHFYMNFGSENQPYYFYKHNHLPWPWKVFKR